MIIENRVIETLDVPLEGLHWPTPVDPRSTLPESAQLDLLYLAWGHCHYGQSPVHLSRSAGWQYVLVNKGKPTLVLEGGQTTLNPGDFLIIGPECIVGWRDQFTGVSDLLIWIWRTPPRCSECRVKEAEYRNGELARNCGRGCNNSMGYAVRKSGD